MPRKAEFIPSWCGWSAENQVPLKTTRPGVGDGEDKLVNEPTFFGYGGQIVGGNDNKDILKDEHVIEVKHLPFKKDAGPNVKVPNLRFRAGKDGQGPVARMLELFSMMHCWAVGTRFAEVETRWRLRLRDKPEIGEEEASSMLLDLSDMVAYFGDPEFTQLYAELLSSIRPSNVFAGKTHITFVSVRGYFTVPACQFDQCVGFAGITQGKLRFKLKSMPSTALLRLA